MCYCFDRSDPAILVCFVLWYCRLFVNRQNEEEVEQYFRLKYADTSAGERFGEGENMSEEITQQGLLPGVKLVNYIYL